MSTKPYRLMTPGPVSIHPDILKALSQPSIHHRTPQFERLFGEVRKKLKTLFRTKEEVLVLNSSGSGAMQAAILNTLNPKDNVLAIVSGKFGERWAQMAKEHGCNVHIVEVPWGESVDLKIIEETLNKHKNIKAILCQACETSTATVHPIRELATLCKNREETLLLVDAITAIGVIPLEIDDWGIDVVVAGSQKVFMLPTGLSFITLSKKAWEFSKKTKPIIYFDLENELDSCLKNQTYFSSSVPLITALNTSLDIILADGLDKYQSKILNRNEAFLLGAKILDLQLFSKNPSVSVIALNVPETLSASKIRRTLEDQHRITISIGQGKIKDQILRIGTMGHITKKDISQTIFYLGVVLNEFGHKCDFQKAQHAVEDFLKGLDI